MAKPKIEIINNITYYNGVAMPLVTPGGVKGTWRLLEPYHVDIKLSDGSVFEFWIKAGFVFDGASIPRFLWRLCGHPLEAPRIAAALAHDWLYRAQVTDRDIADDIFNILCKRVGMACWRTGPEYYALRIFGWAAWRANHKWPLISEARALGSYEIKED
jgi:hypothetical protein